MGWTSYYATRYKNGKIDRKAECDAYFMEGLNRGHYNVLKSAMVGSVYYAAIQDMVTVNRQEDGSYKYTPINDGEIWCAVFLTSTKNGEFYYKDMNESCGPCECKCPKSILKLLSPTDNDYATKWRNRCYEYHNEKSYKVSLNKLPVGSIIEINTINGTTQLVKMSPAYQFKTNWWKIRGESKYYPKTRIPKDYKVISSGNM